MGRLAANVVRFARLLRDAGLPVGPGQALAAARALDAAGVSDRSAVRTALFATLVTRREHVPLFDQAFETFWRDPRLADKAMAMLMPVQRPEVPPAPPAAGARRLGEAIGLGRERPPQEELVVDATLTATTIEALRAKDFEQMTADELRVARGMIERLALGLDPVATRRHRPSQSGARVDLRATLRASLRAGGDVIDLKRAVRRLRPPPVVALCDVSGSMDRYARPFLHFLHALSATGRRQGQRVTSFVFGTRLTNVTRALRHRDADEALALIGRDAPDSGGGTRIGEALKAFNYAWSRRVLAQGAIVLLITDGLEREGADRLSEEAARLKRASRRVVWLNPLLRYAGFEPRAAGVRALLPHVDEHRALYNVDTLAGLAEALAGRGPARHIQRRKAA